MKKIISFEKEISFSSMIGEITSIALDHTLNFVDCSSIKGNFTVSGSYKMTEASTLEERFSYDIPTEIELSEKIDLSTSKISIDDFTYEIINDDILKCNIDVLIEGVEVIELEEDSTDESSSDNLEILESSSDRECDGDKKEDKEVEIPIKEEFHDVIDMEKDYHNVIENENVQKEEIGINRENVLNSNNIIERAEDNKVEVVEESPNIGSLFEAFDSTEETFTTYSVYLFRKEDTLEKVLDKYKVTREILSEYNDLDCLEIGTKLIIPSSNE